MRGYTTVSFRSRFLLTSCLSVAAVVIVFAVFWRVPFRIEGDVAYAAKSAQQFISGVAGFNKIKLVDPGDLSRDGDTWIFWWPPFISAAFILLLKLGLNLSDAGRLLMLGTALSGVVGWAWVAAGVLKSRPAAALASLPPFLYLFQNSMFLSFSVGDSLVFATVPWLFGLALRVVPKWQELEGRALWGFWGMCLLFGLMYWVKYSGFFAALALLGVAAFSGWRHCRSLKTVLRLTIGLAIMSVPVLSLWAINSNSWRRLFTERSVSSRSLP